MATINNSSTKGRCGPVSCISRVSTGRTEQQNQSQRSVCVCVFYSLTGDKGVELRLHFCVDIIKNRRNLYFHCIDSGSRLMPVKAVQAQPLAAALLPQLTGMFTLAYREHNPSFSCIRPKLCFSIGPDEAL